MCVCACAYHVHVLIELIKIQKVRSLGCSLLISNVVYTESQQRHLFFLEVLKTHTQVVNFAL